MRILFVHQNFPAQFGHIARHLIRSQGWQCDFVSETPAGIWHGVRQDPVPDQRRSTGYHALLQPNI